jgi:hypothetical protein
MNRRFCFHCKQPLEEFTIKDVPLALCKNVDCPRFGLLTGVSVELKKNEKSKHKKV